MSSGLLVVLVLAQASAEPPPCPGLTVASVLQVLGSPGLPPGATARVLQRGSEVVVELEAPGGAVFGSRSFETAAGCDAVASAAALVLRGWSRRLVRGEPPADVVVSPASAEALAPLAPSSPREPARAPVLGTTLEVEAPVGLELAAELGWALRAPFHLGRATLELAQRREVGLLEWRVALDAASGPALRWGPGELRVTTFGGQVGVRARLARVGWSLEGEVSLVGRALQLAASGFTRNFDAWYFDPAVRIGARASLWPSRNLAVFVRASGSAQLMWLEGHLEGVVPDRVVLAPAELGVSVGVTWWP